MCGIAGIFHLSGPHPIEPVRLKHMTDAIAHRGPDGDGHWLAPGVALGHRRLAIIDPDGGHQPMLNASENVVMTYNGMIYNFPALRAELEKAGAVFNTNCDTEVILEGWRHWGEKVVERLDGFFAFAIWDVQAETLFLARDRWGKKPLYYVRQNNELFFASDIPALKAALPGTPPIRKDALWDYLCFGYVPEGKSILAGIEKLPPAHTLTLRRGEEPKRTRYWQPQMHPASGHQDINEAAEELLALLRQAVEKRMIADVPLGAFLSGGVDSGAVLSLMADISSGPVEAVTMAFKTPAFDERELAAQSAKAVGARHHICEVSSAAMLDLVALKAAFGEPFADSSALPMHQLCALTARQVKVALSGDGGDEVFAGYRRYPFHLREERLKAALPAPLRLGLFGPLARLYPALRSAPRWLRAKATLEALVTDQAGGLLRATAIMTEQARDRLSPSGQYSSADQLRAYAAEAETDDPLARAQYVDLLSWLPGRMLVKVDRTSMFNGVEVRNPLLDLALFEWAARLPTALKLEGFSGKRVLKATLRSKVPTAILSAPKKGFTPPISDWLRGPFSARMETLAHSDVLADAGVNLHEVRRLWESHQGGMDESRPLWALLILNEWLQH